MSSAPPSKSRSRQFDDYIGLAGLSGDPSEKTEFATKVIEFAKRWTGNVTSNGLLRQWRQNYRLYHNSNPDGTEWQQDAFAITGDNGELLRVRFNQFRNLLQHMLNLNVNSPAVLKSKAVNCDPDSLIAAQLSNNVLEYYMKDWRQGRYQKQRRKSVELALLMSNGYILFEWDPGIGKPVIADQTGAVIRQGDVSIKARSVFDVFFDTNCEDEEECFWVIVRDYVNRYEYAKRYPDQAQRILDLQSKVEVDQTYHWNFDADTDLIPVFKYYHRSNNVLPNGRFAIVLDEETVLHDGPNPYIDDFGESYIPMVTIRSSEGLGTLYGYSPANDIAPIQMAYNALASALTTNYITFGVQNVVVPKGADISVSSLAGGANVIEVPPGMDPPHGMNMTAMPQEGLDFMSFLKNEGETSSGINSVVRGDPDANLKSGKSLNIVAGMAVQFMSGLQASVTQADKDAGNILLRMFKQFASTERVIAIAGKDESAQNLTWTGSQLKPIGLVTVEEMDPAFRTLAWKEKTAEFLVQNGMVKNAQEYFTVLSSGRLEPLYKAEMSQINLVHQENNVLLQGGQPNLLRIDNHELHIAEHVALLGSPAIRQNPQQVENILDHINWHERATQGDFRDPATFKHDMMVQQMMAQQAAAHGMTPPPSPGQQSATPPPGAHPPTPPPQHAGPPSHPPQMQPPPQPGGPQ